MRRRIAHLESLETRALLTTFVVNNVGDSGLGSLRQAIVDANNQVGPDAIEFNIPGAGIHTFSPETALPTITDPVAIDGTTQPGYNPATHEPLIELEGSLAGSLVDGLVITAGDSSVHGLAISAFDGNGILLQTNGNNSVWGCWIGTTADGLATAPNGAEGIFLDNSAGNVIGGVGAGEGNLISGNFGNGIFLTESSGNQIVGNRIGVDATGSGSLSNFDDGISLDGNSNNNRIGGTGTGEANVIANNGGVGVYVPALSNGNSIRGNILFGNLQGGIDLAPVGSTANDLGDMDVGANGLQNFPILSLVESLGSQTKITGMLNSLPSTTYLIDLYASISPDPSGHGQAEQFVATTIVVTDSNGDGNFSTLTSAAIPAGMVITATATSPTGDTSEFAANAFSVNNPPQFVSSATSNVPEGTTTSTVVLDVNAADADLPGQTLSYSLSGPDAVDFNIDSTGQITFAAIPDYEAPADADGDNIYLVTVTVSDDGTPPLSVMQDLTINVTNVAPTTPVDTNAAADSVTEGAATGTPVGITAFAADPHGPAVIYSLTDNAGGRFAIDASSGVVTVANGTLLEMSDATSHMITVQASDGAGGTSNQSFTIQVMNLAPTVVTLTGPTKAVPGLPLMFKATASDSPGDIDAGFTYRVNWGDGTAVQTVNGPSMRNLNHVYTKLGTYTVLVTATDRDGATSAQKTATVVVSTTFLQAGVLYVGGGGATADMISFTAANATGKAVTAKLGAKVLGTFTPTKIVAFGNGGNDTITTASAKFGTTVVTPNIPLRFFGGAGNDTLNVSANRATSVLVGDSGNDTLTGSSARDILIGGLGLDTLAGNGGDDILVAGRSSHDGSLVALDQLMAKWGGAGTYAARRDALLAVGGTTAKLIVNPVSSRTVFDDGAVDTLLGDDGNDWFLASTVAAQPKKDKVTKIASETLTQLPI